MTCWLINDDTKFILQHQYSQKSTYTSGLKNRLIGLHSNTYELFSFKLYLQFDVSFNEVDLLLSVKACWESQKLFSNSVVKWHEVAQTFEMVDYVREMTAKKLCQLVICF